MREISLVFRLLTFASLTMAVPAFAQFNLEHTYSENQIQRINLENSGEKYYLTDNSSHEIKVYNADHSLWKSIPFEAEVASFSYVTHLSESTIDPDGNIEFVYTSISGAGPTSHYSGKVVSENGNVIVSLDEGTLRLDEKAFLPNKIISERTDNTSDVYGLPSGVLEHHYGEGFVKRIDLEISGEKYYVIDTATHQLKLFNSNHTIWKTIDLPKPDNANYVGIGLISENQINADPLLEVSYSYYQNLSSPYYESKLINENGVVLMTVPNASFILFDHIAGCDDKVTTKESHDGIVSTSVYSAGTLTLEHSYPTLMSRIVLDDQGEKYYTLYADSGNCVIYNADHSVWKSIPMSAPPGANLGSISHISVNHVNSDPLVEIAYGYTIELMPGFSYECRVINEFGNVLLTVPSCLTFYLSAIPGQPDKFIANMISATQSAYGNVYNVGGPLERSSLDNGSGHLIFPNPASNVINMDADAGITSADLYNISGMLVQHVIGKNLTTIKVEDLMDGVYLMSMKDNCGRILTNKIVIHK